MDIRIMLDDRQEKVLRRLIGFLERARACYQFSGGFAGNLHGSTWPLHDFDLDVAAKDLPRLTELLSPHVYHPLGPYRDDEFSLTLLRARIDGVEIDISQAEGGCGFSGGRWVPLGTDLSRRICVPFLGMKLWVQPLEALIAYKKLIGRTHDLEELERLNA